MVELSSETEFLTEVLHYLKKVEGPLLECLDAGKETQKGNPYLMVSRLAHLGIDVVRTMIEDRLEKLNDKQ